MEPIKRVGFEQSDRQAVEGAAIVAVQTNLERFLRAYVGRTAPAQSCRFHLVAIGEFAAS